MLTSQKVDDFARDGFVVVRGMYSEAEVTEMSAWINALAARRPVVGHEMAYFEDSQIEPGTRILSRIEKFAEPGQPFAGLVAARRMLDPVEALLGEPAILFKEKINFKLPGGGGFEPHQDIQPGWDDYAPYFLSVLVSIDESTTGNGCLELAAGAHKLGLLGERWKPLTSAQLTGIDFQHFPLAPGDAAFFDCFVPHQSQPNLTSQPRRSLYLTYNRASDGDHRAQYFADKRRNFPPDNEREPGRQYAYRV